jgi:diguanylate cyclase (GGDEF)-like protein
VADRRPAGLLLALTLWVSASPAAIDYTVADGLSQNSAQALARDPQGFVWIGTEDGLNRFDGYEFRVYRPGDKDAGNLAAAYIDDIAVAGPHLFLATNGGGLAIFDRSSERFRTLGVADGMPTDYISVLSYSKPGQLYLGTRSGLALASWRGDPMSARLSVTPIELGPGAARQQVWALQQGPSGLWIGTGDGVLRIDSAGTLLEQAIGDAPTPLNIDSLLEMPAGVLWVGTWDHGLYRIDLSSGVTRLFKPGLPGSDGLRSQRIGRLAAAPAGRVYIGTDRGLTWFDPACECIKAQDQPRAARVAGRGFPVEELLVDERGGVFVGYWGEGLTRFSPNDLVFHVESRRDDGAPGLAHERVRALLEDRRGDLWVGTFGGGVQRVRAADRQDGLPWRFESWTGEQQLPESGRLVWALLQDRGDRIWAATDDGVYWTDADPVRWHRELPDGLAVPMPGARTLLEDRRGRIWVGSSEGLGLIEATGARRRVIDFADGTQQPDWMVQQDRTIFALFQDADERIWVGTWAGLHVLDGEGRPLAQYRVADGLPGPIVWDIHRHTDGSIWIGSNGGLARVINPEQAQSLRFENFTVRAGLPTGTVYGITSDREGQLWLTGNRGLVQIAADLQKFRVWHRRDGIAADEFSTGAVTNGNSGWVYFGGIAGLTAVDPTRLRDALETPVPSVARLTLGNTLLPLDSGAADPPLVSLNHEHSPLIVDLTALVFDAPRATEFAYRLDASAAWTNLGTRRSLIVDHLPNGRSQLEVRADNQGQTATRVLLTVQVAPPFYASWAFRISAVLFGSLLLMVLYGWRVRALTTQRRQLEAEVAARTGELRNQKEALEATAAALVQANSTLKTLSVRDPLTGLSNRRELIERIGLALAREDGKGALALAVIDLDHFKRINDEHGHLSGDAVLRDFAEVLREHMGSGDAVGRWGGEEFLALIAGTNATMAQDWAQKLIARVRSRGIPSNDLTISYRISIGLALARPNDHMDSLVARADRALYSAKDGGRDQAVLIGSEA